MGDTINCTVERHNDTILFLPGVNMTTATTGCLYLVPTPIGNLADITERAITVLQQCDAIAAEDTRHSGQLLQHFGIQTPMFALHEHNERQRVGQVIERLQQGQQIALISDAGMPLISDPGYVLVMQCRQLGIPVSALPGACAVVTALAGSGLPTDRFTFEGFLPAKPQQRRKRLQELVNEPRTLIFYESPHRILDTLADVVSVFGASRPCVLARELSKQFETYLSGSAEEIQQQVAADSNQQRGEIVLMLGGAPADDTDEATSTALRTVAILRRELPLKKAAALAAEIHGVRKNALYQLALASDNQ